MVEQDLLPVLDRVTLRAFRSENALMPVHFFMAFNAGLRRFPQLRGFMTLETVNLLMASLQFKSGLVMVKEDLLPILCRMTALALLAESPLVLILFEMAPHAGDGRGLEIVRGVAFFTRHRTVFSFQRKFRLRVVETDLGPGIRIMTALAALSQRSLVLIFFEMTGMAVVKRIAEFRFLVASVAFCGLMLSGQFKFGFFMVEMP